MAINLLVAEMREKWDENEVSVFQLNPRSIKDALGMRIMKSSPSVIHMGWFGRKCLDWASSGEKY